MGAPRLKSKRDNRQSIRFTANAAWRITPGGKLRLPKIGDLKVKWSRTLPSTPTTVTVVRTRPPVLRELRRRDGRLEVLPETTPEVGIDLGLGHFAVLSDGTKADSPRFLRRAEKRLKKTQRALSRTEKGSRNRNKARLKVARAHARVADARREFHHHLSTRIIRENQAVAVEDLAVKGLARTRLAKSVHDAGWSAFVTMLEYKAARYGRTFVKIGWFEPTSQVCSRCGVKDGPKPLNVREWTCKECGAVLDRDINAAVNIAKAAGLAVSACGAQVRPGLVPAPRSAAGTHPKRPTQPVWEQAGIRAFRPGRMSRPQSYPYRPFPQPACGVRSFAPRVRRERRVRTLDRPPGAVLSSRLGLTTLCRPNRRATPPVPRTPSAGPRTTMNRSRACP
ncbi:RNA-guided endonuclease InsQ/TnpB family protein [Streptomyces thermocarboxydus]